MIPVRSHARISVSGSDDLDAVLGVERNYGALQKGRRSHAVERDSSPRPSWKALLFWRCCVKEIPLTKGKIALVDDADYEWLMQWKWHVTTNGYAVRRERGKGKPAPFVIMHRALIGTAPGMDTDHIDGNKPNNQRNNLRMVTRSQNNANIRRAKNSTSGFKGVSFSKSRNKWSASISLNRKYFWLGYFNVAEDAYEAYCRKAKELFGEYARFE